MPFELSIENWLSTNYDTDEIRHTTGALRIELNGSILTRVYDRWTKTVRDEALLSAYPLALWFASSWWRLLWESCPKEPDTEWRMAHEMASVGDGYIWPQISFDSDCEKVNVRCFQSEESPIEPIQYLTNFHNSITITEFESVVESFINSTIARLDAMKVATTTLHHLWQEVQAERRDKESVLYRQIEAQIGFEPDEAPEDLVNTLLQLAKRTGEETIREIATVCSGHDAESALQNVIDIAQLAGVEGEIPSVNIPPNERERLSTLPPWSRGYRLAQIARTSWNRQEHSDYALSSLLGISKDFFTESVRSSLPVGLAVRYPDTEKVRIVCQKRHPHARRFEATRLLADSVISKDSWLISTDTFTARQKVQRAFAAEFLCPIAELQEFLNDDFSDDSLEGAGEYFGVSPKTVEWHLINHKAIPYPSAP